jgi:hypothetical protein
MRLVPDLTNLSTRGEDRDHWSRKTLAFMGFPRQGLRQTANRNASFGKSSWFREHVPDVQNFFLALNGASGAPRPNDLCGAKV